MPVDIDSLSWVKGEIDLALERAAGELTTYTSEASAESMKNAAASLHKAVGALVIVGIEGITEFGLAIERDLLLLQGGSVLDVAATMRAVQAGIAALRRYLDDLIVGQPHQPVKLYEPYRDLIVAAGDTAPNPAELFFPDLAQRPPEREPGLPLMSADELAKTLKAIRPGFDRALLKWIKGNAEGLAEMQQAVSRIESLCSRPETRAYWWVTSGVLDAILAGGLDEAAKSGDVKKFVMRMGREVSHFIKTQIDVIPRQLRDALYLAAKASTGGSALAAVRETYHLDGILPTGAPGETERLLPHLRRLRELLAAAKDDWNRLCAGTAALLPFLERVEKIEVEGAATEHPDYTRLTAAIVEQTVRLQQAASLPNEALGMEMATALMVAESVLENFQALDAEFTGLVHTLVGRLEAAGRGEVLDTLDLPSLDAMSRKAQERLLLKSVAQEIKTNLSTVEQTLDAFFRDTSRQSTLAALTKPIHQIQGAFAVLSQDRANAVLGECAREIERFAQPEIVANASDLETVAKQLAALSFFTDRLQHGGADIDEILEKLLPEGKK